MFKIVSYIGHTHAEFHFDNEKKIAEFIARMPVTNRGLWMVKSDNTNERTLCYKWLDVYNSKKSG